MSLGESLKAEIAAAGPISIARYMTVCLHDPRFGYYATRPALGAAGDFVTAPLVSQMFGELLGLWAVETWIRMGLPPRVILAEIGPGDGTLMGDMLRAAKLDPAFIEAAEIWLVEVSPPLRARQRTRLGDGPRWAETLAEVPGDAPLLLVANELLDCLPAHQFIRIGTGWAERMVGLNEVGELTFGLRGLTTAPVPADGLDARLGDVVEQSPAQEALGAEIGERLARQGGAALLIDYGRDRPGLGDTLQALRRHRKEHPLAAPGEADLTVHADFPAVVAAAKAAGAEAAPILPQGEFLRRLGVETRAQALARARPEKTAEIGRQLERLVDEDQMGSLFKACCLHAHGLTPPGFEEQ